MNDKHLTLDDLESFVEDELDPRARAQVEEHVAECAPCRARLARARNLSRALYALPRRDPPLDLAARIGSAVESHVFQERLRRSRMPFIGAATFFSAVFLLWFAFQMVLAFQDNGTLDLISVLTARPDLFSLYSTDAIWAVIEALPLGETALTLFALFTVIVLAQQWVDAIRLNQVLGRKEERCA